MKAEQPAEYDDPRLTAYALGELDAAEHAEIEAWLARDATARAAVAEIRATTATLGAALAWEAGTAEPAPAAGAGAREWRRTQPGDTGRLVRFPQWYFVLSGVAAACFALFFVGAEADRERRQAFARAAEARTAAFARAARPASAGTTVELVAPESAAPERFVSTAVAASSAFPLRVGRGAWAEVRADLRRGQRPGRATVRVAELVNAFDYAWPAPAAPGDFAVVLEGAVAPWAPAHRLVRVGVRAVGPDGAVLARGARVRVDFNPDRVREWRLIGFERAGAAGVAGTEAGETLRGGAAVTALYELVPAAGAGADGAGLLTLSLHYAAPADGAARTVVARLAAGDTAFAAASPDFQFAAAVAAFGLTLRDGPETAPASWSEIAQWASAGATGRPERLEFLSLVERARTALR